MTALPHNKVCSLEDFADAELRAVMRDIFPHEIDRFGENFPQGREYRKYWEVAMGVRALRAGGALGADAEILGVGAGNEPTLFYLTRHARRVFATDLYLGNAEWSESANVSMLSDPGRHWIADWDPRRLVVQHMDALDLKYEDNSFDAIFSSSSIEHFGTEQDVRRSLREMWRVLKPGGVASLSTEYRIAGDPPGLPGILLFDRDQLHEIFLTSAAWHLLDALDLTVSRDTMATEQSFDAAGEDVHAHVQTFGELVFHKLEWSRYPHIVLRHDDRVWTSVHLALQKRG